MISKCPFLREYKVLRLIEDESRVIFKCDLGKALLKPRDLNEKWACGGCSVPYVLGNSPCRYIKPGKDFLFRGSSYTFFVCELLDIKLESPEEFCKFYCRHYIPKN
nr:MAG: hypothetical protein DIU66_08650 [Bacillota bacterium]